MRGSRATFGILAGLLVLAALAHASAYAHAIQDDAFISYRYATNLVDLGSLTFNGPGFDRVEGYSNLTWVLLLSVAYGLGIPPLVSSKLFGLACLVGALLGAARLVDEMLERRSAWRFAAMGWLGTSAWFVSWSVQGLETALVAAVTVWAAVFFVRFFRDPHDSALALRCGAIFGLLALSRPETGFFGGLAGLVFVLSHGFLANKRSIVHFALAFGLPVLLQTAFRFLYYDRLTSNTFYAKMGIVDRLARGVAYLLSYAEGKGTALVLVYVVVVLAAIALVLLLRRRPARSPVLVALLLLGYCVLIAPGGGDWMRGFRFVMHVLPLAAALGVWAAAELVEALPAPGLRRAATGVVVVALAFLAHSNFARERAYAYGAQGALRDLGPGGGLRAVFKTHRGPHFFVADWLRESLPPGSVVAVSEAGIMPFASGLPVIDYLGLNDRQIADFIQQKIPTAAIADYVLALAPDAVVMLGTPAPEAPGIPFSGRLGIDRDILASVHFSRDYRLAHQVPMDPSASVPGRAFGVFVRRDVPGSAAGTLSASPNPVPGRGIVEETTVSWSGWPAGARLFVGVDGGAEKLFDGRSAGDKAAPWIQHAHIYVFRLYDADRRLLAAVPVTRVKAPPLRLFAPDRARRR